MNASSPTCTVAPRCFRAFQPESRSEHHPRVVNSALTAVSQYPPSSPLVDFGQVEAGFIMNPVKVAQLKAIALNGERMPPKTTYFYPKVLSGLTVYKMD